MASEILKIIQRMHFLLAVGEHFRLPIIHLIITLVAKLKNQSVCEKHIRSYSVGTNGDTESTLSSSVWTVLPLVQNEHGLWLLWAQLHVL